MAKYEFDPIDWITMKRSIAALAEDQRRQAMQAEKLAAADDKIVAKHRDYWLALAARHYRMADFIDELWQNMGDNLMAKALDPQVKRMGETDLQWRSRLARAHPEIEITPAMIEAGAAVYRLHYAGFDLLDGGGELAADVFLAMLEARAGE